jgi:hypothetical protein
MFLFSLSPRVSTGSLNQAGGREPSPYGRDVMFDWAFARGPVSISSWRMQARVDGSVMGYMPPSAVLKGTRIIVFFHSKRTSGKAALFWLVDMYMTGHRTLRWRLSPVGRAGRAAR